MNFKKILAAFTVSVVAAGAMALTASALPAEGALTKVEAIKLDSNGGDSAKMARYDLTVLGTDELKTVTIVGTVTPGDGWTGGGGAVGLNLEGKDWSQVDFSIGDANVTVDDKNVMTAELKLEGKVNYAASDSVFQIGWWWGSGEGTLDISDIKVNGTSIMGNTADPSKYPEPEEEAADEADADEGDADEATEEATDDADADDAEVDNGLVKKFAPITLNANGDKLVQYDLGALKADSVDVFTIIGKVDVADDGWVGGGGGVGYNSADGWIQIDFNIGEGKAVADDEGNMVAVLDFTELGKDTTLDTSDPKNLFQIGWWWGSGEGNIEITDIGVNGVSLSTGKAITTTLEDDAPAIVDTPVIVDAPAAGDVDAATDSSKGSPDTGVADVAAVAGLAIVAAGAVIVSKKRK